MSALDLIRRVENLGGQLVLQDGKLMVNAAAPLPDKLLKELSEQKASIMVALGAPLDTAISEILEEVRPHLPQGLRRLPEDKLLVLINWSIINSWFAGIRKLELDYRIERQDRGRRQ